MFEKVKIARKRPKSSETAKTSKFCSSHPARWLCRPPAAAAAATTAALAAAALAGGLDSADGAPAKGGAPAGEPAEAPAAEDELAATRKQAARLRRRQNTMDGA